MTEQSVHHFNVLCLLENHTCLGLAGVLFCSSLVEIKRLLVLTAATTALIDVVEQSHYDNAIL
jgi:hypothetical protein